MAHYEGKKDIQHWFPRVNHLSDDLVPQNVAGQDNMLIEDDHQAPYIGDFPPKDDYKNGIFY